jgi:hypothetical protein
MDADQMLDDFAALPVEAQNQVIDFIAVLRRRNSSPRVRMPAKASPLGREPFVGMWSERTDMLDSTAWTHELREREWAR